METVAAVAAEAGSQRERASDEWCFTLRATRRERDFTDRYRGTHGPTNGLMASTTESAKLDVALIYLLRVVDNTLFVP